MSDESMLALSLKGVSKTYMQGGSLIDVLKNVDLEVRTGQMVAIIGASGSGKSTLLHIAGLLDSADKGSVSIGAEQIKNLRNANRVRLNNMGFIYQYHHLLRDFTAQENAAMPLFISGVNKQEAMERAGSILSDLGLAERLGNMPGELSGGEQQRVAVARALINNPKIILADEPTGNLDKSTADEVFAMFLERAEKFGSAVVMVSHNLELASRMHKIYRLECGLLEEECARNK